MQNSFDLLEKVRNYKPQSSVGALESFLESSIYFDFQNELLARIEVMRDAYETSDSKTYIETKGGIRALREQAFEIFSDLLQNRKSDLEESHGRAE